MGRAHSHPEKIREQKGRQGESVKQGDTERMRETRDSQMLKVG